MRKAKILALTTRCTQYSVAKKKSKGQVRTGPINVGNSVEGFWLLVSSFRAIQANAFMVGHDLRRSDGAGATMCWRNQYVALSGQNQSF